MHKQQCDFRWIMVENHNTMKIKVKFIVDRSLELAQLIQYTRVCASNKDFLDNGLLLSRKLLYQGFQVVTLILLL